MGLDMYLMRRHYVQNWDHMKPSERHTVTVKGPLAKVIKPERISYIEEQVGYWRKANQIHRWFVDNCQDGVDDCRDAYVSEEQLTELRDLCRKVLDTAKVEAGKVQNGSRGTASGWEPIMEDGQVITNATAVAELLPAASGFFFGSTDYDSYYLQDVQDTFDMLDALLKEESGGNYYYRSSW